MTKHRQCVRCGLAEKDADKEKFCELDNKGSNEWICRECAYDLGGCEECYQCNCGSCQRCRGD